MSLDPANDARLARERARQDAAFRETARLQRETAQAAKRASDAKFYQAMKTPAPRAPAFSTLPFAGTRPSVDAVSGQGPRSPGSGDAWTVISVLSGLAAGLFVWTRIDQSNPLHPFAAILGGLFAGWVATKIVDSHLVRGLVKLAVFLGVAVAGVWVVTHLR